MKVKDFIKKLQTVDPEAIVVSHTDDERHDFYEARMPSCKIQKYYINKQTRGCYSPLVPESDYFPEDHKKPLKEFGKGCLVYLG